jgi:hypothetical protein
LQSKNYDNQTRFLSPLVVIYDKPFRHGSAFSLDRGIFYQGARASPFFAIFNNAGYFSCQNDFFAGQFWFSLIYYAI